MVVTGAGGQVGRLMAAEATRRGYQVAALTRRDLDITDFAAVDRHIGGAIGSGDVVVNCAAFTNVDAAESAPEAAYAVNASGPGNLARVCARASARLVHLSTDYVFGGEVFGVELRRPYEISDPTGPINVYGHSKLAGERAVHDAMPEAHVVRTSWVFSGGPRGTDFVSAMRAAAATDRTVDMVADQTGSPTYAADLVEALLDIARGGVQAPLLHVANSGWASRLDQSRAVFAAVGADPERIRPVNTAAVRRPARRPLFSALGMAESVRAGLTPLRPWREALGAALREPDPTVKSPPLG
jgi:dTDP-4-dehydrorhamnose reductase